MSILFFDIDCTLLSHKTFTIPDSALEALRRAKAKGHRLFIASGRSYNSTLPYLDPELFDGAVTGSGSCAAVNGVRIFEYQIEPDAVSEIYQLSLEAGAGLSLQEFQTSWMTAYGLEQFRRRTSVTEERIRQMNIRIYDGTKTDHFCKMDMFFEPGYDPESLLARVPSSVHICRTLSESTEYAGCELTPAGRNKGSGALELMRYIGADPNDSYAFGDSENDIPAIKLCGVGVAMGNAMREVKEAADYVTEDIERDGIYLAMEHFNLI